MTRIASITIESLFGHFNHRIKLNTKDRITIIHGPNGVGKTTILRLIYDLFSQKFLSLSRTRFEKIVIRLIPKGSISVTKKGGQDENSLPRITLLLRLGDEKIEHTVGPLPARAIRNRFPLSLIERIIAPLERVGPEEWLDRQTGNILSFDEIISEYGDQLPDEFQNLKHEIPDRLLAVLNGIDVSLIETQRLLTKVPYDKEEYRRSYPKRQSIITVEEYSQDVVNNIQATLRESGSLAASLDQEFPQRLLETELPNEASEGNIRKLYREQADYRDRLMKSGLIEPESQVSLPSGLLGETERKVLWIYLNDVQKKLGVFDSLLAKVELLIDIINSRYSYKQFAVRKDDGFTLTSHHDGSKIPLRTLSSGEQHELVLAYDLLFKVKKNSVVFIDEPELSLHVSWQRKFLEDIGRISKLADLDFIIATHSPSIIHNRRDLMVGLAEEE